ncbi:MAG TPA: PD-(D/E)XK nuclease family protein [Polyangiaceae bacterium]|nr:PD-(D/E)XK nuclease family protein [Polyangiaceae bacterium]
MSEHRVVYSYSHLDRFVSCPRLFQLHYIDRLPADDSDASRFGVLLHRTCEAALFEHVACRRSDGIEPASVVRAYRRAWEESELGDTLRFEEGLEIAKSWAVRQGCVAWHEVIGIEEPFEMALGDYRIVGKMDRVERAGDVVRVRDYKTTRVPMSREEVEGSLQLAIYDLAAYDLWPGAKRVELEIELLRHGTVIRTSRTDEQRAATREYILATIAKIEAAERAGGEMPTRPTLQCATCDHRSQCREYADALAAKRTFVCTDHEDLVAVSREREEVARLVKVLVGRKEALEAILKAQLRERDELRVGGMRYSLGTAMYTEYPVDATLDALERLTGLRRDELLERLASIGGPAVRKLVSEIGPTLAPQTAAALKATLDLLAARSFSTRLVAKEERPAGSQGGSR